MHGVLVVWFCEGGEAFGGGVWREGDVFLRR